MHTVYAYYWAHSICITATDRYQDSVQQVALALVISAKH